MSNEVEADTHSQTDLTEADASKDTSQEVASGNSPNLVDDSSLDKIKGCLLYTSPSPRDLSTSRMPSSA